MSENTTTKQNLIIYIEICVVGTTKSMKMRSSLTPTLILTTNIRKGITPI